MVGDPLERLNAVLDVIENRPGEDAYVLGAARALFAWYEPFWRLPYNTRDRSEG